MPLDDIYQQFYLKTTPGMNTKSEELELNGKWVKKAQNLRFEDEPGAVTKRPPLAYFNSTPVPGVGGSLGLYRYYGSANIKELYAYGDKIYAGDDASGVFTEIRDLNTSGYKTSFVTYKDLVYGCNGQDNIWVYDGSDDDVTWELGACKALVGGAGTITATDISYKITYDADAYIPGTVSNTIASVTNQQIELSHIPFPPIGATNRKVWRKDSTTGGAYLLVGTITDNIDTTFTDDNASPSGVIGGVTDIMPKGDILIIHKERLFITGDPTQPNRIYYSDPYRPHYIQQTVNLTYIDVALDDGDEIQGLAVHFGTMICFKRNTIRKMFVTQAGSGADPATWYADDPIAYIGSPCKWSITETPRGIVFLSWNNWYIYDGSNAKLYIPEFDTSDILTASYTDVVGYYNKEVFYAAYADSATAATTNDRVMVYNMKLSTFSVDTINASCFSAHTGDSESGELYIGDSTKGSVYKAEESDLVYRLSSKTQADNGTSDNTFIGGTESTPYIEIGGDIAADPIIDDVCIFWDDPESNPGTGWVDITSEIDGKYIYFSSTYGGSGGGAGHTHPLTGSLATNTNPPAPCGNNADANALNPGGHSHTANGTSANGQTTHGPRHVVLRLFKRVKGSGSDIYEFPNGALVLYDQASEPTGFWTEGTATGYYIKGGTDANFFDKIQSAHTHSYSYTSGTPSTSGQTNCYTGPVTCVNISPPHTHTVSGTLESHDDSDWELDYVAFTFIRKVGDQGSWDGVSNYVYCLYANSGGSPANGWEKVTTYNDMFLKIGDTGISTGSAANASHTHTNPASAQTSGFNGNKAGNTADRSAEDANHVHDINVTVSSGTHTDPPYTTFCLVRKVLGQMATYNSAITSSETNGVWTSPALQLNPDTLESVEWNSSIESGDTFTWHIRTGSTQASVEDATAITTVDNTTDTFTEVGHGLSDGDRVVIDGTVIPTGLSNTIMYYVVGVAGNDFQVSLTSGGSAVDFSSNGTAVTFKQWFDAQTVSGSTLDSSLAPTVWIQYICVFTATDTVVSNPRIYLSNSFVVRIIYTKQGTLAETSVEFIYETGFMNADTPMLDKIWKKVSLNHVGTTGVYTFTWETENASGVLTIDLSTRNRSFDSFFQSDAMGKRANFTIYKNDLHEFQMREIHALYTDKPVII